jgi:predicted O-methyltransferase YrrM
MSVLKERYEVFCSQPGDIFLHLPAFVSAVSEMAATKVIELGVRHGISTTAWLYALENKGHLWSVDTDFPTPDPVSGLDLGDLEVEHWLFLKGDDRSPLVTNALPMDVDIVFIDTSHAYDHTLAELHRYSFHVRSGGRILLHDTEREDVRTAVETFCEQKWLKWENTRVCNGLGTIFVP